MNWVQQSRLQQFLESLEEELEESPCCPPPYHHLRHPSNHTIEDLPQRRVISDYSGQHSSINTPPAKVHRRKNARHDIPNETYTSHPAQTQHITYTKPRKQKHTPVSSEDFSSRSRANQSYGSSDWSTVSSSSNQRSFPSQSCQQSPVSFFPPRASSLNPGQNLAFLNSDPYGDPDEQENADECVQNGLHYGQWSYSRSTSSLASSARDSLVVGSPKKRSRNLTSISPVRRASHKRCTTCSSGCSNAVSRSANHRPLRSIDGKLPNHHSTNSSISSLTRPMGHVRTCSSSSGSRQNSPSKRHRRSCSLGSSLRHDNLTPQREINGFDFDFGQTPSNSCSPGQSIHTNQSSRSSRYLAHRFDLLRKRRLSRQLSNVLDLNFQMPGFDQQLVDILDQLQEIEEQCAQYEAEEESLAHEYQFSEEHHGGECDYNCDCNHESILCEHEISDDFRSFQNKSNHQRSANNSISSTRCNLHVPRGRLRSVRHSPGPKQSSATLGLSTRFDPRLHEPREQDELFEDSIWMSRELEKLPSMNKLNARMEQQSADMTTSTTTTTNSRDTSRTHHRAVSSKHSSNSSSKVSSFSRPFNKRDNTYPRGVLKQDSQSSNPASSVPITPPRQQRAKSRSRIPVKKDTPCSKTSLPSLQSISTLSISTADLFPTPPSAANMSRTAVDRSRPTTAGGVSRYGYEAEDDLSYADEDFDVEILDYEVVEARPVVLRSPKKPTVLKQF